MTDASRSSSWWRWAPYLVAVGLAAVYVLWAPHTADLAGQTARAELFRRSGFVPFWTGWYAGIPTASYSLTTPALLGWIGPVWLGAVSIVATAVVAVPLLRDAARPTLGAVFLVVAAALNVISGRTTFAVGVVAALAAVLAAERRRPLAALLLAAVATVTSPVAGFLLLVVAITLGLVDADRRRCAVALGAGVIVSLGALAWLSRGETGGYEPFTRTSLLMALGTAAVVAIAPAARRVRVGAVVVIAVLLGVYFVHSSIGANATRVAVLAAAPVVVATVRLRSPWLIAATVAVASLLPLAQLHNDLAASHADDTSRQFVAPLLQQLDADPQARSHRVEVVDTATHWPSTYLVPHVGLARGWERQIDETRNPLFYGQAPLTPTTYRGFLDRNAVSTVAVATGVSLDYGATREAALIARGLPYLHLVWHDPNWRLYAVSRPTPIVTAPAVVTRYGDTGLSVTVPAAGRYFVRMRWSPYLAVDGGQVARATDGDVALTLTRPGRHELHAEWQLP